MAVVKVVVAVVKVVVAVVKVEVATSAREMAVVTILATSHVSHPMILRSAQVSKET